MYKILLGLPLGLQKCETTFPQYQMWSEIRVTRCKIVGHANKVLNRRAVLNLAHLNYRILLYIVDAFVIPCYIAG